MPRAWQSVCIAQLRGAFYCMLSGVLQLQRCFWQIGIPNSHVPRQECLPTLLVQPNRARSPTLASGGVGELGAERYLIHLISAPTKSRSMSGAQKAVLRNIGSCHVPFINLQELLLRFGSLKH